MFKEPSFLRFGPDLAGGGGGAANAASSLLGSANPIGLASSAFGTALGGYEFFKGLSNENKDKRALANIHDPFYKIQDQYLENRNLGATMAGGGTPQSELDYASKEREKGLGATASSILQGGGTITDIGKAFDLYNKDVDRTAAASSEEHLKNIQYFMNLNKDLAGQRTTQWALNQYQPTREKRAALSGNIATDQQQQNQGINTALGSLSAGTTSVQNNPLLKTLGLQSLA